MHVSVLSDLKDIFQKLGHTIKVDSLSNHTWVNNERRARIKGLQLPSRFSPYWGKKDTVYEINQEMCDEFYRLNKDRLNEYDAFVVSYPPAFSLLFEKFNKPIIVVACTRFDFPCVETDRREWLVTGLQRLSRKGHLLSVANNKFDKKICEQYTDFEWQHIPSLCEYLPTKYMPNHNECLLWFRGDPRIDQMFSSIEGIEGNFSIQKRYDRTQIGKYRGVVHVPYQISIMSAFEHYAQAIPIFFPTQGFVERLMQQDYRLLSELSFYRSGLLITERDLHLADFYDEDNFKHVQYFDSLDHLQQLLTETRYDEISQLMQEHQQMRRHRTYSSWTNILGRI